MAHKQHNWQENEEPTLESMNNIEQGIAKAEASMSAQFGAVDGHTDEKAKGLIALDGSKAASGTLDITGNGKGIVFDNGNGILGSGSNINAAASSIVTNNGAVRIPNYYAFMMGYRTSDVVPSGSPLVIPLTSIVGRTASGASASLRSGGIAIDNPDGPGYYVIYCSASFTLGPGYKEYRVTLSVYSSTNGTLCTATADQYAYQTSTSPYNGSISIFITCGAWLASGGYLIPSVAVSFGSAGIGTFYAETASIVAVRKL